MIQSGVALRLPPHSKVMSDELIKVAEDNGIVTITLNRPDRLNAFIDHMRRDLAEALEETGSDPHVHVVVINGAGRAFCAGGDVQFMAELVERNESEEFARLLGAARRVVLGIRQMTKPVIASIEGPAFGAGFNLALACDLRIASSTATFSQAFVKLGFHPDWGGTYFLPRMVTSNIACETGGAFARRPGGFNSSSETRGVCSRARHPGEHAAI